MNEDDGMEILAESIIKIEKVEEEADNNLEKTIWYFTELSDADTLKNTIKEEDYDEDELEPPVTVFVEPEVKEEEIEQKYEDPLSLCGDNLSNAFLEKEESLRSPNTGGGSPTTGTSRGAQTSGKHTADQCHGDCTGQFCKEEVAASTLANPCEKSLCAIRATDITSTFTLRNNMNVVLQFVCNICQKELSTRKDAIAHIQYHTLNGPCKCTNAPTDGKNVVKHEQIHSGEGPYECNKCKRHFLLRTKLVQHMLICTILHCCPICKKKFACRAEIVRHMASHRKEDLHSCTVCQKNFSVRKELISHMLFTHSFSRHCSICKVAIRDRETLDKYEFYECSICKRSFTARENFVTHMQVHMVERPFECGICEESFSDRGDLLTHLHVHVGKTKKECAVCQRSFVTSGSWHSHVRVHIREKLYECSLCQKRFPGRRVLFEHVWKHVGERKLVCLICQKKFKHTLV